VKKDEACCHSSKTNCLKLVNVALPDLDKRSPDEILGYNQYGLPGIIMVIDTFAVSLQQV
jgi:hypothetical protein